MAETPNKTQEPTPEVRASFARGTKVSLDFLMEHLLDGDPIVSCKENADILGAYILEHKLSWTLENLNIALEALRPMGVLKFAIPEQVPDPVEEIPTEEAPADPWPWGQPLTAARLEEMSGKEVRRWMTDRHYGREFKSQMENAGLTQSSTGRL